MNSSEKFYVEMLLKKGPEAVVAFIQTLDKDDRKYTIELLLKYAFEEIQAIVEEPTEEYTDKKDLGNVKEYLKKFQLQK